MATDFFQRQSDARRRTGWLVVMFLLAVVGIVATITTIAALAVNYQRPTNQGVSFEAADVEWEIPLAAGAITLLLIGGGSLFKVAQLRGGGGTSVAEGLGGRRLYPNTQDKVERRLLNVVEEMAIASGTPVPPVFMLDQEQGINAFAAGYSPSDAVLGITRGCAEQLSRDELQGVIAHEFSHILNGDMCTSIRLIGVLHGILLLGLLGQIVFRAMAYSGRRSRDSKSGGGIMIALLAMAVTLIVVGFIGTFFGNLIKAAVSRQREYLADASAVQFTRNPSGIANALRKIGSVVNGSKLVAPGAAEASHMYFSIGVWEGFAGLWATHPPLAKRIKAIDPNWDGKFPTSATTAAGDDRVLGFAGATTAPEVREAPTQAVVDDAVEHVGVPTLAHHDYARQLLASVPSEILSAARDPYGARAITFCLLMDREPAHRRQQIDILNRLVPDDLARLTAKLQPGIDRLDVHVRLPLVDLAMPALRALSVTQYQSFAESFNELVTADQRLNLFEWVLSRVLFRHLQPQFADVKSPPTEYYALHRLGQPLSVLFSAISWAGHDRTQAERAFAAASKHFPELQLRLLPTDASGLGALTKALDPLSRVVAKQRARIVDACAASICADEHIHWREAELLRGVADLLDCPVPPLLVKSNSYGRPPEQQATG